jgi:hypothetical protein
MSDMLPRTNQGQAPYFGKLRDISSDSTRPFDIPARESYNSRMTEPNPGGWLAGSLLRSVLPRRTTAEEDV